MSTTAAVKRKARSAVMVAKNAGRLAPADLCECCRHPKKVYAHHRDYSRPLDIEWLCQTCHWASHRPDAWQPDNAVEQLKQAFALDTDVAVGVLCGVKKQTVADWRKKREIPPKHVIDLQRLAIRQGRTLPPILDPNVASMPQPEAAA